MKLDYNKITEAIDKNNKQELEFHDKEDDLRRTNHSMMSY